MSHQRYDEINADLRTHLYDRHSVDLEAHLDVMLEDRDPDPEPCPGCDGTGEIEGVGGMDECPECQGTAVA